MMSNTTANRVASIIFESSQMTELSCNMFLLACLIFVASVGADFAFFAHLTDLEIVANGWFPSSNWHSMTLSPLCSGSRLVHQPAASQSTCLGRRSTNFCCFIDHCLGVDNLKYHRGRLKVVT